MNEIITVDGYRFVPSYESLNVYKNGDFLFETDGVVAHCLYYFARLYSESKVEREFTYLDVLLKTARDNGIVLTGEDYWKLVDTLMENGASVVGDIKEDIE